MLSGQWVTVVVVSGDHYFGRHIANDRSEENTKREHKLSLQRHGWLRDLRSKPVALPTFEGYGIASPPKRGPLLLLMSNATLADALYELHSEGEHLTNALVGDAWSVDDTATHVMCLFQCRRRNQSLAFSSALWLTVWQHFFVSAHRSPSRPPRLHNHKVAKTIETGLTDILLFRPDTPPARRSWQKRRRRRRRRRRRVTPAHATGSSFVIFCAEGHKLRYCTAALLFC